MTNAVSITINLTPEAAAELYGIMRDAYGYREAVPDPQAPGGMAPTGKTVQEFTGEVIAGLIRSVVMTHRENVARARAAAATNETMSGVGVMVDGPAGRAPIVPGPVTNPDGTPFDPAKPPVAPVTLPDQPGQTPQGGE